jgi:hypothetical protein
VVGFVGDSGIQRSRTKSERGSIDEIPSAVAWPWVGCCFIKQADLSDRLIENALVVIEFERFKCGDVKGTIKEYRTAPFHIKTTPADTV